MSFTGYRPSRRTTEDPILYPTSAVPPVSSVTDLSMIPVLDQFTLPFCVEHAVTTYVMWLYYKQTGKVVLLSPRSLVINVIRMMGSAYVPGGGTAIGTALKAAQQYGIAEDSLLTNDTTLSLEDYTNPALLTDAVNQNALKYRVQNYYFLSDLSQGSFQQTFSQYGLILYGIHIDNNWWTSVVGNNSWMTADILPIRPPASLTDPTISAHLICGKGYDTTPFDYFRNEWGTDWGQKGDGWFGSNDVGYVYEAAVIESLVTPIQQADQIVNTIQKLQDVETPQNTPTIQSIISGLWTQFLSLFNQQ